MNLDNIHIFHQKNEYAAFHGNSFNLIELNKDAYNILRRYQQGETIEDILNNTHTSKSDVKDMLEYFSSMNNNNICKKEENNVQGRMTIERITLHVSNDCNLRCKYCYAAGGCYDYNRSLMTLAKAKEFIDFCTKTFDNIKNIVFFGGEPFLNTRVIEYICSEFIKRKEIGEIKYCPKFGAITNGTILSEKVFEIIKKYFSFITLSIDGPQDVNDVNRIDIKGTGTFDKIMRFYNKIIDIKGLLIRYEATFTQHHIDLGYSHKDIKDYLDKTLKIKGDVITEHNLEKSYNKKMSLIKQRKINENDMLSILSAIVNKKEKEMCQLYRNIIAISVEGDIYPCHMNVGNNKCSLGNISSQNIYSDMNFPKNCYVFKRKFKDNTTCKSCWANNICGGCSRIWFFNEEEQEYNTLPNKDICYSNKKYLESILLKIIKMRNNPQILEKLISNTSNY